jgi:hypothetical protein
MGEEGIVNLLHIVSATRITRHKLHHKMWSTAEYEHQAMVTDEIASPGTEYRTIRIINNQPTWGRLHTAISGAYTRAPHHWPWITSRKLKSPTNAAPTRKV